MMPTATHGGISMHEDCHADTVRASACGEARTCAAGSLSKTETPRVEQAPVVPGFELDGDAICRTDRDDASWCRRWVPNYPHAPAMKLSRSIDFRLVYTRGTIG